MAYIGKQPEIDGDATDIIVDTITGNGSTTTMTVSSVLAPASVNNISVFVAGLMQVPGTDYTLSSKTITFTTAPANGLKVVAISHVDTFSSAYANAFATGHGNLSIKDASVTNDHIDSMTSSKLTGALPAGSGANLTNLTAANVTGTLPAISGASLTAIAAGNLTGTVADARISTLTASKLSGALPALNASNLTGIVSDSITKNSSDPAVTTNPSSGVGTLWSNSTSGEAFVCTDATTNRNVWTNIGEGRGNIDWNGWGTQYGYSTGGHGASGSQNQIDRHSFTADSNAVDVGDLLTGNHANCGSQDLTHGYVAGGFSPAINTIQRFSFATGGNSSSVGTLTVAKGIGAGASSSTHGYIAGGDTGPTSSSNSGIDVIEKFAFSASTSGSDIGDLSANRTSVSGVMSETHGYIRGGRIGGPSAATYNIIERWPFASDTNATDVGDTVAIGTNFGFNGQNSKTHGYITGGEGTGNPTRLQKHAFASSANATEIGSLAVASHPGAGQSSNTNGYTCGSGDSAPATNHIQKFSFVSDGNAADIGDLTVGRGNAGGLSN